MTANEQALIESLVGLDKDTFCHSVRTRRLALTMGELLGLEGVEIQDLALGAFLHDIGKLYIPDNILHKQTPLTEEEWSIIQDHPTLGVEAVKSAGLSQDVSKIVLEHHRWANGEGGYPQHLQGAPTLLTQIVSVADVLDAMTSPRPYRSAYSVDVAVNFIYEHSGTRFSSTVVNCLRSNIEYFTEHISHQ